MNKYSFSAEYMGYIAMAEVAVILASIESLFIPNLLPRWLGFLVYAASAGCYAFSLRQLSGKFARVYRMSYACAACMAGFYLLLAILPLNYYTAGLLGFIQVLCLLLKMAVVLYSTTTFHHMAKDIGNNNLAALLNYSRYGFACVESMHVASYVSNSEGMYMFLSITWMMAQVFLVYLYFDIRSTMLRVRRQPSAPPAGRTQMQSERKAVEAARLEKLAAAAMRSSQSETPAQKAMPTRQQPRHSQPNHKTVSRRRPANWR